MSLGDGVRDFITRVCVCVCDLFVLSQTELSSQQPSSISDPLRLSRAVRRWFPLNDSISFSPGVEFVSVLTHREPMNQLFKPSHQDVMLAVNDSVKNTDVSEVDICSKRGTSCSHHTLVSLL